MRRMQVGDEIYAFEFSYMACEHTYRVILYLIFDLIIYFIHPHLLGGNFHSEAATAPVAFTVTGAKKVRPPWIERGGGCTVVKRAT